jgi:hypothetical protein
VPSTKQEELSISDTADEDSLRLLDPADTCPIPDLQYQAAELSVTIKQITASSPSGSQRNVALPKVNETS